MEIQYNDEDIWSLVRHQYVVPIWTEWNLFTIERGENEPCAIDVCFHAHPFELFFYKYLYMAITKDRITWEVWHPKYHESHESRYRGMKKLDRGKRSHVHARQFLFFRWWL